MRLIRYLPVVVLWAGVSYAQSISANNNGLSGNNPGLPVSGGTLTGTLNICGGGAYCGGTWGTPLAMTLSTTAGALQGSINGYLSWSGSSGATYNPVLGLNIAIQDYTDSSLAPGQIEYYGSVGGNVNAGSKGLKVGLLRKVDIWGNPGDNNEHIGGQDWGVLETGVTTGGNLYGNNVKVTVSGTMTGAAIAAGSEYGITSSGTIAGTRAFSYYKLYSDGTNQGDTNDAALLFFNDSAQSSTYGLANGLQFGAVGLGHFPLSTTGNLINLVLGLDSSATIGSVVNIPSGITVSNYYWNSPNWTMSGAGVSSQAGSATFASGSTNGLSISGGSGSVYISATGSGNADITVRPGYGRNLFVQNSTGYRSLKVVDAANGSNPNYIYLGNAISGSAPYITVEGIDTNSNLFIGAAGTGVITLGSPIQMHVYTVSGLPSGVTGARAYVGDAVTCVFGAAPTGSGSTKCPVFYNGSAWVGG